MKKVLIGLAAVLLGIISYYFFKGWYNIIPWAIATLIVGYISNNRRHSIINGAIFGYILFLVYILIGYSGKTDAHSIINFILFNASFSLVGAIAGIIGSFTGNLFKKKFGS